MVRNRRELQPEWVPLLQVFLLISLGKRLHLDVYKRQTPVLALLSDPVLANHTRGNIQEVAARGAKVLTIAEENVAKDTDDIVLTTVHPYLSPISMVVPTQLVAYFATLHRGLDVDKPRNLAKSVTVE